MSGPGAASQGDVIKFHGLHRKAQEPPVLTVRGNRIHQPTFLRSRTRPWVTLSPDSWTARVWAPGQYLLKLLPSSMPCSLASVRVRIGLFAPGIVRSEVHRQLVRVERADVLPTDAISLRAARSSACARWRSSTPSYRRLSWIRKPGLGSRWDQSWRSVRSKQKIFMCSTPVLRAFSMSTENRNPVGVRSITRRPGVS